MPSHAKHSTTALDRKKTTRNEIETYLTDGVDVDVVLSVLRMRNEWLDKELSQNTIDSLNSLFLASSCSNPLFCLSPGLVQAQKTTLASSLDQLIRLCDEFGARDQQPWVCDLGLVKDIPDICVCWEVQRSKLRRSVVRGRGGQRSRLDHWGPGEMVVEDGLAVGLED